MRIFFSSVFRSYDCTPRVDQLVGADTSSNASTTGPCGATNRGRERNPQTRDRVPATPTHSYA